MKLVERKSYLSKLIKTIGTPDIKVITGVRRCGKSKLMEALIDYISDNTPDTNIIHINFNLLQFEPLTECHALHSYIETRHISGKKNVVCIDEVQMCQSFEKTINSLHASEKYDIFVTGSNAFLMSSDLATLFTGRTMQIEVFPFSFNEYLDYFPSSSIQESFDAYVKAGGMAGSYLYQDQDQRNRYLNNEVFNALIVRDIVAKHKIRNRETLDRLVDYMMDNIGNLASAKSIARTLGNNDKTIASYINHLCRAFAFYKVRRYDLKGKKYLANEDKYYLSDQAFRFARLGNRNMDYGRLHENLVAIELIRRGYEVYVGVLYKKEVDFVAIRQNEKMYVQVSDDISAETTFEREIGALSAIKDHYPKILIARTRHEEYDYNGIRIIDIAHWLSNQ